MDDTGRGRLAGVAQRPRHPLHLLTRRPRSEAVSPTAQRLISDSPAYVPPKVWTWDKENGGAFSKINRPVAGPTHEKELPVGRHPLQLYSLGTPNGVKVTIMLEELLALGHGGA